MGRIMAEEVELVVVVDMAFMAGARRGLLCVSLLSHITCGGEGLLKNST
jgi:hypothetical protein